MKWVPRKWFPTYIKANFASLASFSWLSHHALKEECQTRVNEGGEKDSLIKLVQPARHLPFYQVVPYFLDFLLNPLKQNKYCVDNCYWCTFQACLWDTALKFFIPVLRITSPDHLEMTVEKPKPGSNYSEQSQQEQTARWTNHNS